MNTTPEPTLALVSIHTAANLTGMPVIQIKNWIAEKRVTISVIRKNTYGILDDIERLMREDTTHEQP